MFNTAGRKEARGKTEGVNKGFQQSAGITLIMALVVIRWFQLPGCDGGISVSKLAAWAAVAEGLRTPNYGLLK